MARRVAAPLEPEDHPIRNIARTPAARLGIGLLSSVIFGFFGLMMVESRPLIGWVLIGLASARLALGIREFTRSRVGDDEGSGDEA